MDGIIANFWTPLKHQIYLLAVRVLRYGPVPNHVSFILDGHRRYARAHGMQIMDGHRMGFKHIKHILKWCLMLGVKNMTVYTFSIMNFNRSPIEVKHLMQEFHEMMQTLVTDPWYETHGVQVRICGELHMLEESLQKLFATVMHKTSRHKCSVRLNFAMAYTSQQEMCTTIASIQQGVKEHHLKPCDVSTELIDRCLYTRESGPTDLSVRTSLVTRLSDFLLWQSCNRSLLQFVQCTWPEYDTFTLLRNVFTYQRYAFKNQERLAVIQSQDRVVPIENTRVPAFIQHLDSQRDHYIQSLM